MEPRIELAVARGSVRGQAVSLALHALAATVLLLAPAAGPHSERSATPAVRVVVLSVPVRRPPPATPGQTPTRTRGGKRNFAMRTLRNQTIAPALPATWENPPAARIEVPEAPSGPAAPRLPEPGPRFGQTRLAVSSAPNVAAAVHSGFAAAAASRPAAKLAVEGPTGGFETARAGGPTVRSGSEPQPPPVTRPVEILAKPLPRYTEAARARGIEGEVWIEAFFPSEGAAQALRVLRGLGHGLDEEARRGVAQVRFRPAERDGLRIDAVATLRIIFELADSPLEKSAGAGNGLARSNP